MNQKDFIMDKEIRKLIFLNELKDKFIMIAGWSSLLLISITVMLVVLNVVSSF